LQARDAFSGGGMNATGPKMYHGFDPSDPHAIFYGSAFQGASISPRSVEYCLMKRMDSMARALRMIHSFRCVSPVKYTSLVLRVPRFESYNVSSIFEGMLLDCVGSLKYITDQLPGVPKESVGAAPQHANSLDFTSFARLCCAQQASCR
jgi:hypothetical protein